MKILLVHFAIYPIVNPAQQCSFLVVRQRLKLIFRINELHFLVNKKKYRAASAIALTGENF